MKKKRLLLSFGALLCALFLSGCMAAMIPAMVLGHASHGQRGSEHGSDACIACEHPSAAQADLNPAAPSNGPHKH